MPQPRRYYEPDALDCNTCITAIGHDFGHRTEVETRYERDQVLVLVRCFKIGGVEADVVQVQAKVSAPLKGAKSLYVYHYSALLDCWHQLDRGVLAVAKTPIQYSWLGRPNQPAPHE